MTRISRSVRNPSDTYTFSHSSTHEMSQICEADASLFRRHRRVTYLSSRTYSDRVTTLSTERYQRNRYRSAHQVVCISSNVCGIEYSTLCLRSAKSYESYCLCHLYYQHRYVDYNTWCHVHCLNSGRSPCSTDLDGTSDETCFAYFMLTSFCAFKIVQINAFTHLLLD